MDIVGVASTVNYFQIAYCLQCEVAKQLNFTKLHFYANPQLINIAISSAFEIQNLATFSKKMQTPLWEPNKYDFDTCIQSLENTCKIQSEQINQKSIFEETISFTDCCGLKTNQHKFNYNEQLIILVANYLYLVKYTMKH